MLIKLTETQKCITALGLKNKVI